ncbi:Cof-type HAD-IIB family hydrolase [Enterocloster asparagiformis]|uniref:Cof-type HAD-IIB family hydrolase n=1 Tax=Enterocloster asparagiformis TaxID=333367 RepID=UPI00046601A1|nr:Cof-type HAD-IIB family hydrolase [Enterocloster asparagiformis]
MIKMIAADLDGTLLNDDGVITPATKNALIHAQENGIRMVIATGRSPRFTAREQEQLQMERFKDNYIIALNGQEICRFSDGHIWRGPRVPAADVSPVLKLANDYCLEALCYDGNVRYQYLPPDFQAKKEAWLRGRQAAAYKDHESILGEKRPITSWEAPFPREVNKIALLHSSVRLQEVLPLIRDRLAPGLKALLVKPNWLEIIPTGVSKGEALKRIMEETGIQTSEVAVFGDGENDIDMIKTAGYGFAMGNAFPSVKQAAFAVTASNNQDGIAKALRFFAELGCV